MTKETVVNMAPYSVPDHRGHHIAPGEVAQVEMTPSVRAHVDAGRFVVKPSLPVPTPEPIEVVAPRRRPSRED